MYSHDHIFVTQIASNVLNVGCCLVCEYREAIVLKRFLAPKAVTSEAASSTTSDRTGGSTMRGNPINKLTFHLPPTCVVKETDLPVEHTNSVSATSVEGGYYNKGQTPFPEQSEDSRCRNVHMFFSCYGMLTESMLKAGYGATDSDANDQKC